MSKRAEEIAEQYYPKSQYPGSIGIGLRYACKVGYEEAVWNLGWISVRERMPEPGVTVWTCVDFNGTPASLEARFYIDGKWYGRDASTAHVDYWMPVQPLKKKED